MSLICNDEHANFVVVDFCVFVELLFDDFDFAATFFLSQSKDSSKIAKLRLKSALDIVDWFLFDFEYLQNYLFINDEFNSY